MSDFFDTEGGGAKPLRTRNRLKNRILDRLADARLRFSGRMSGIRGQAKESVLIVGVEVPSRPKAIHQVIDKLRKDSRHDISVAVVPMETRGKFENINAAISAADRPLCSFDWLVVTDDDIAFLPNFLDDLISLASAGGFAICQPAHAFESYTSFAITKRVFGSLARRTKFVEIGPLTLIHSSGFSAFVPFPHSRWCYGIDLVWSEVSEKIGLTMGIIDGTPVQHLRPVAASYNMQAALDEGRGLLQRFEIKRNRAELFGTNDIVIRT